MNKNKTFWSKQTIILTIVLLFGIMEGCKSDGIIRIPLDQPIKQRLRGLWVPHKTKSKIPAYNQRYLSIKGGDIINGELSFRIALCDANSNDRFDEVGVDMIYLCPFGVDSTFIRESASQDFLNTPQYLRVKENWFIVDSIHPRGHWIEIEAIEGPVEKPFIELPDQLPRGEITLLDGRTAPMGDFLKDGKYLYVEVFSTWHQRSFESTPTLKKTYERYRDSLNILSLVFNEVEYPRVHKHIREHQIPWDYGIYTDGMGEAMMITYLPYGALYAPDGRLIKTELRPRQLRRFLEKLF